MPSTTLLLLTLASPFSTLISAAPTPKLGRTTAEALQVLSSVTNTPALNAAALHLLNLEVPKLHKTIYELLNMTTVELFDSPIVESDGKYTPVAHISPHAIVLGAHATVDIVL